MQQCNAFGRTYSVNCISLLLLLSILIITSVGFESAQAHIFSPDKTASLLAIANQLKSELKLVGNNLVESDEPNFQSISYLLLTSKKTCGLVSIMASLI
jgi:hypothetical protein